MSDEIKSTEINNNGIKITSIMVNGRYLSKKVIEKIARIRQQAKEERIDKDMKEEELKEEADIKLEKETKKLRRK